MHRQSTQCYTGKTKIVIARDSESGSFLLLFFFFLFSFVIMKFCHSVDSYFSFLKIDKARFLLFSDYHHIMNKINRMNEGSFIIKTNTNLVQTQWKKAFITFGCILRHFSCLHISEKVRTLWTIVNRNGLPFRMVGKRWRKKAELFTECDWLLHFYLEHWVFVCLYFVCFSQMNRMQIEANKMKKKNRRKMLLKTVIHLYVRLMKLVDIQCTCVQSTVYRFGK